MDTVSFPTCQARQILSLSLPLCIGFVLSLHVEANTDARSVNRVIVDSLLETKLRQWSSDAVELVNRELGPETNFLYDYLSPSSFGPDPLFAGPRSGLTFRRAGKVLLYSFNLRVVPDNCLDMSTSINRDLCLVELKKFYPPSSTSPTSTTAPSVGPPFLFCRAHFSLVIPRPWKRRSSMFLDSLTSKVVSRAVQCKINGKWRKMGAVV